MAGGRKVPQRLPRACSARGEGNQRRLRVRSSVGPESSAAAFSWTATHSGRCPLPGKTLDAFLCLPRAGGRLGTQRWAAPPPRPRVDPGAVGSSRRRRKSGVNTEGEQKQKGNQVRARPVPKAHSVPARGPGLLGWMEQVWLHLPGFNQREGDNQTTSLQEETGSGCGSGAVGDVGARRVGGRGWKGLEGEALCRGDTETNTCWMAREGRGGAGGGAGEERGPPLRAPG